MDAARSSGRLPFSVVSRRECLTFGRWLDMETRKPSWELAHERCPCCDGQGELVFSKCPSCGLVVLICAEVGSVFEVKSGKRGDEIGWSFGDAPLCRACTKARYEDFVGATWEEIQALGFKPGDYR